MTSAPHSLRRRIGHLPETLGFRQPLLARKNLGIRARPCGVSAPRSLVMELLEEFGWADRAQDPAATFFKGTRQRLAPARAPIHDPPILPLDEPTAGLDPEAAPEVRELLRAPEGRGRAVSILGARTPRKQ